MEFSIGEAALFIAIISPLPISIEKAFFIAKGRYLMEREKNIPKELLDKLKFAKPDRHLIERLIMLESKYRINRYRILSKYKKTNMWKNSSEEFKKNVIEKL